MAEALCRAVCAATEAVTQGADRAANYTSPAIITPSCTSALKTGPRTRAATRVALCMLYVNY